MLMKQRYKLNEQDSAFIFITSRLYLVVGIHMQESEMRNSMTK